MPGKRKRAEETNVRILENTKKPMSAIAAARFKAEAASKSVQTPEIAQLPDVSLVAPEPSYENLTPTQDEDEEDDSERMGPIVHIERSFRLCNWQNDSKDILSDTNSELTINLRKHTTIALIGFFKFNVLRGAINILGANISAVGPAGQKSTTYYAYVPATHPILQIRGLDGSNRVQFMTCTKPVPLTELNPLFTNIWQAESDDVKGRSFSIITDSSADQLCRALAPDSTPELWLQAIEDCTASPSITLITGSTGSGKSTFAKRLSNRFLTGMGKSAPPVSTVAHLCLNPRKQEYAPNGQVSLVIVRDLNFGPAFTHPTINPCVMDLKTNEMIRAHPVPTNLADYVDYYHGCVEDLFSAYQNLHSCDPSLSLIIDIPGFLYDSHFDLLARLLTRVKPQHIIHLGDRQNLDTDASTKSQSLETTSTQYRGSLHHISAYTTLSIPVRTATEIEAMQMQSYFHLKSSSLALGKTNNLSWTSDPLSNMIPWEFCYEETSDRYQDFVGFAMYTGPIDPASSIHALNGSVMHITQSTSSRIPSPYNTLPRDSRHHLPYFSDSRSAGMVEPLDPRTSQLICTAMIRGFDLERRLVQVLVPETHHALLYDLVPERTVFVYGCCDTPEWAYVEDTYAQTSMEAVGGSKAGKQSRGLVPWVSDTNMTLGKMGYLNTRRRVRKFQA